MKLIDSENIGKENSANKEFSKHLKTNAEELQALDNTLHSNYEMVCNMINDLENESSTFLKFTADNLFRPANCERKEAAIKKLKELKEKIADCKGLVLEIVKNHTELDKTGFYGKTGRNLINENFAIMNVSVCMPKAQLPSSLFNTVLEIVTFPLFAYAIHPLIYFPTLIIGGVKKAYDRMNAFENLQKAADEACSKLHKEIYIKLSESKNTRADRYFHAKAAFNIRQESHQYKNITSVAHQL